MVIGMLKGTRSTEECEGNFLRRFLMKRSGIKGRKDVKEPCFRQVAAFPVLVIFRKFDFGRRPVKKTDAGDKDPNPKRQYDDR